ncbi:MAG: glycosyltransferase [Planctomycetota bacterium]|jgi:glycosyltransferase involved in cell wall biosynthesis
MSEKANQAGGTDAPHLGGRWADTPGVEFPPLPVSNQELDAAGTRVCIASMEVVGPHLCGGIGTHYTTLAEVLARAGAEVTLLFMPAADVSEEDIERWAERYAERGVRLVALPNRDLRLQASAPARRSYAAYLWTKDHGEDFDVLHFAEWGGVGYYTLLAKRQGLGFGNTCLVIGTHSPLRWIRESNRWFLRDADELATSFLERRSVAMADVVVSPSQYLLNWMRKRGWQLPPETYVQSNILPFAARQPDREPVGAEDSHFQAEVRELVFFGRLEDRKGLVLFCDALDILVASGATDFTVTFLGRPHIVAGQDAGRYLKRRGARWPFDWRILGDRNQPQAMQYLGQAGRLAVIPSLGDNLPYTVLECLGARIPLLAAETGGIPEMVAPEDRAAVLFPTDAAALAERLSSVLEDGVAIARPAVDVRANELAWIAWHAGLANQARAARGAEQAEGRATSTPLVSVCLAPSGTTTWLRQALESVLAQDYENWEVVLVDNGTMGGEVRKLLDELGGTSEAPRWRVVECSSGALGAACNEAAREARGEYLLFLGARDCPKSSALSVLVGVAAETGADVLTCCADGYRGDEVPKDRADRLNTSVPLGPATSVGVFRNCFGGSTCLVRRDALFGIGGFAADGRAGDVLWEFYARAVLSGLKLEVVPESLCWSEARGKEAVATDRYLERMRAIRPYLHAVQSELEEMVLLAQGQETGERSLTAELRTERNRYKNAYEAILNRPPIRAYRAMKRLLLRLLGRK